MKAATPPMQTAMTVIVSRRRSSRRWSTSDMRTSAASGSCSSTAKVRAPRLYRVLVVGRVVGRRREFGVDRRGRPRGAGPGVRRNVGRTRRRRLPGLVGVIDGPADLVLEARGKAAE